MARKFDQRSRALRRNLRKQARKGTLSSREKKDLLTQEARFRKATRRRRPYTLGLPLLAGLAGGAAALKGGLSLGDMIAGMRKDKPPVGDPDQTPKVNANGEVVVDPAAPVVDEAVDYSDPQGMGASRATMDEFQRIRQQEDADSALVDENGNNLNPNVERIYDVEEEDVPPPVVGGPGSLPPEVQERLRRRDAREQRRQDAALDSAIEHGLDRQEVENDVTPIDPLMDPSVFDPNDGVEYANPERMGATRASDPNQRSYVRDALADLAGRSLDDPRMEALRSLDPVPLYDYVEPPGEGTPTSQGRDAQQQAQNELARLRAEDQVARGQEYNDLWRQIRENANTIRPIDDFDEEPEDFFEPDVEADLLRFRNRNRALPGSFSDIDGRLADYGNNLSPVEGRRSPRPIENVGAAMEELRRDAMGPQPSAPLISPVERMRRRDRRRARNAARLRALENFDQSPDLGMANGGKNPTAEKLMQRIKAKYGMK